jgi:signal transduction histidine kinase
MAATSSTHLPPTRLRVSRSRSALFAWILWGLSVTLLLLTIPLFIAVKVAASQASTAFPFQLAQHLHPSIADWVAMPLTLVAVLAFSTFGALIITHHPKNCIGWLLCTVGLLTIVNLFAIYYADYTLWVQPGSLPGGLAAAWVQNWMWAVEISLLVVFLPFLFPTGQLLSRRWRPAGWFGACVVALLAFGAAFHPGPLWNHLQPAQVNNPLGIEALSSLFVAVGNVPFGLLLIAAPVSASSLLLRWRRARGEERLQIKWFAFVGALLAGLFVVQALVRYILLISTPAEEMLFDIAWNVAFAGLPLATGLAILKYHLYDIDLIINRTLVYGALTAIVVGVYVLAVGSLGTVFQASGNILISLLATGLVAVFFQPLREGLQRVVNHLMYGERDEPHAVLTRLGSRLEAALSPDAVLPVIVETVAQALKLPYVAISLRQEDGFRLSASHGAAVGQPLRIPLIYQSEQIGELLCAPRGRGETFTPADRQVLGGLARQVGIAAHAVRLTADLQRSRERLVTAREEERRRLRRDLHDGLGPTLAGLSLKVGAVRNLLLPGQETAETLLNELSAEIEGSVADIRRIVYDLRPPSLDELGLVGAIRARAAQYTTPPGTLNVLVEVPHVLPALPAAIEVAVYRIVQEALNNVVHHAQAETCRILLSVSREVCLEVIDDGRGFPENPQMGVGLLAMRERAVELGGTCVIGAAQPSGIRVHARLPLTKE